MATRPPGLADYEYSPIEAGSIRLLKRDGWHDEDARIPKFILIPKKLDNAVIQSCDNAYELAPLGPDEYLYTAISYFWGSDKKTHGSIVDGKWLETTASAFEIIANRTGRWADDENYLFWIDYICINQADMEEKSVQVGQMDQVYSRANFVIGYLNPVDDSETELACTFLDEVVDQCGLKQGPTRPRNLPTAFDVVAEGSRFYDTRSPPRPQWQALANLLWLKLCLLGGLSSEDMQRVDFTLASVVIAESFNKTIPRIRRTLRLRLCHQGFEDVVGRSSITWEDVLPICNLLDATNPLDRIYGLLGLLKLDVEIPESLNPNYKRDCLSLFLDLTERFLDVQSSTSKGTKCVKKNTQWILSYSGIGYYEPIQWIEPAWPSWCPNWRLRGPIPLTDMLQSGTSSNVPVKEIRPDRRLVIGRGFRVDSLRTVIPIAHLFEQASATNSLNGHAERMYWNVREVFRVLRELDMLPQPSQRGSSAPACPQWTVDALGKTLTAGLGSHLLGGFRKLFKCFSSVEKIVRHATTPDETGMAMAMGIANLLGPESGMTEAMNDKECLMWQSLTDVLPMRSLGVTWDGNLCLVPRFSKSGDEIFVFKGGDAFFTLRRNRGEYLLVGNCYVEGIEAKAVSQDLRFVDGLRSNIVIK